MTENNEIQLKEAEGDKILQLQRDMVLIKDRLDLLENGLYSERKRHSGILRTIRKLKEDPEVQEVLEALQPQNKELIQKKVPEWVKNLKAGDPLPYIPNQQQNNHVSKSDTSA